MPQSLVFYCEQFEIELLAQQAGIPNGFRVVHFDDGEKATGDRIVVKGEVKDRRVDGVGGFDVDVEIQLKLTERNVAKNDAIMRAIDRANTETPALMPASAAQFAFLDIVPEAEGDREAAKKTRQSSRKFRFIAKEIS